MIAKIFWLTLCISITSLGYAESIPATLCPAEIKTSQNLTTTIKGWRLFDNSTTHYLSQIEIYADQPERLANLKPDSQTLEKAIWHFQPGTKPYIVCRYHDTAIQLTQPLPASVTQCTLWYQKYVRNSSGGGVPEKISCR